MGMSIKDKKFYKMNYDVLCRGVINATQVG